MLYDWFYKNLCYIFNLLQLEVKLILIVIGLYVFGVYVFGLNVIGLYVFGLYVFFSCVKCQ